MADLEKVPFGSEKVVSLHPRMIARSKMSAQRVEIRAEAQDDGLQFANRSATVVGYPVMLELTNEDSVVVKITDLEIRRRPPHLVGRYEDLIGTDPIVLQPQESWVGKFIVSRKSGWYRVTVQAAAPEGWLAIPGPNTRSVYFREETNANLGSAGYSAVVTFWNLSEEAATFRYWLTADDGHGVPKSSFSQGLMELEAGEAIQIEVITDTRNWSLVTAPPVEEEGGE